MHGDAAPPRPHVLAAHPRGAADLLRLTVGEQRRATELGAELGVVRQGRGAAVDVELGVAARVAAVGDRERDQLLARAVQRLGQAREQRAALGERQLSELGGADRARVHEGRGEIVATLVATSARSASVAGLTSVALRAGSCRPRSRRGNWRAAACPCLSLFSPRVSSLTKRLLTGFIAIVVIVFVGGFGYYALGDGRWTLGDCLYMTVITVTDTVGYDEVLTDMKLVEGARAFTVVLLVFGTGSIVYFASTITAFIVEGDLRNVLFASKLKKRMKRMKDHVVVVYGAGSTGRNVIEELLKTGVAVVAIDTRESELKDIADKYPKAEYTFIVGDATDDDIMNQTNQNQARGLVAALSSDKDNLYLTVSARQTNAKLRIVARCAELSHVEKIKRSGADAVVSPNFIGGMRMVSELLRPAVVRFLDDMLRDRRAAYRIEEIRLGDRASELGTTLRDAKVRERFGMTVLAVQASDSEPWTYNPDADVKIGPGVTLVVLGSSDQVSALRNTKAPDSCRVSLRSYLLQLSLQTRDTRHVMVETSPRDLSAHPRVSVVVRSFNRLGALAELLTALLAQDHDSFEVVVIEQSTERPPLELARIDALARDSRRSGSCATSRSAARARATPASAPGAAICSCSSTTTTCRSAPTGCDVTRRTSTDRSASASPSSSSARTAPRRRT